MSTRSPFAIGCVLCGALAAVHCTTTSSAGAGGDGETSDGGCSQPDEDGVVGGSFTFEVSVSDTAFSPVILKAQNRGQVTLTVKNTGTKPHDLAVQCLSVQGCTACFPDAAKVGALAPGASKTVTFSVPEQEGIYSFGSDVAGDTFSGQFILQ